MLGSYKKQLQAAVDAKSAELKAGVNENVKAEEPKADEAKTEEPKTEEPKTDNSTHHRRCLSNISKVICRNES